MLPSISDYGFQARIVKDWLVGKKKREISVLLPTIVFIVGMTFSGLVWVYSKQNQIDNVKATFANESKILVNELQKSVDINIENIIAIKSFFDSSDFVDAKEFSTFTNSLVSSKKAITALEWAPYIKEEEWKNPEYQKYNISELKNNQLVKEFSCSPHCAPIAYIEPMQGNEIVVGFDLLADKLRSEALEYSRDTGLLTSTARVSLVQSVGSGYGFLMVAPVYEKYFVQSAYNLRKQKIKGFVVAVFEFSGIVEQLIKSSKNVYAQWVNEKRIKIYIYDEKDTSDKLVPLYETDKKVSEYSNFHDVPSSTGPLPAFHGTVNIPGRAWKVVLLPSEELADSFINNYPIIVSAYCIFATLLLTLLTSLFLLAKSRANKLSVVNEDLFKLNNELESIVAARTRELEINNEQLHAANEELEQFAYLSSHDLQEPLRRIVSYIDIVFEDCAENINDEAQSYLMVVKDSATRMSQLIRDLLEFSKLGQKALSFESVDTSEMVKEITNSFELLIRERKAKVTMDSLPVIDQCSKLIKQVFQNLIANGIKFCPPGRLPEIKVQGFDEVDNWKFTVSDNGIGIEEKDEKRIFEVFRRLHRKEEYAGTGIGLSICRKIIERHGGTIWHEQNHPVGSVFCFTIPKHKQPSYNN